MLALVPAACSGGSSKKSSSTSSSAHRAATDAALNIQLQPVLVADSGPKHSTLDDGTRNKALSLVNAYVNQGVMKPLTSGAKVGDLSAVFDTNALAHATGADAPTLFDEGFAKVSALKAKTATVTLTDLADQDGSPLMIGAALILDLEGTSAGKAVHIHRLADLALAPDNGTWKIMGYDVAVQRDGAGVPIAAVSSTASSTAASPSSGASKP